MKHYIVAIATAAIPLTVNGNIFKDLQKSLADKSEDLEDVVGIKKVKVPNTNMYYFKFMRSTSKASEETDTDTVVEGHAVLDHPVVVNDKPSYDPVISKNPKSGEVGASVEKRELNHIYGSQSPLRDDAVAAAWRKANEAEERLRKHREYMETLRKLRLEKAAAKDLDGARNDN